jgi:hypothetical protein
MNCGERMSVWGFLSDAKPIRNIFIGCFRTPLPEWCLVPVTVGVKAVIPEWAEAVTASQNASAFQTLRTVLSPAKASDLPSGD